MTARQAALAALAALVETEFDRVYIYPDDYETTPGQPELPFVVVEELPGARDEHPLDRAAVDHWTAAVYAITSWGEHPAPSDADAVAKVAAIAARDTLVQLVRSDVTLQRTAVIGQDADAAFTSTITPLQYNQKPAFGVFMALPVVTEADELD